LKPWKDEVLLSYFETGVAAASVYHIIPLLRLLMLMLLMLLLVVMMMMNA